MTNAREMALVFYRNNLHGLGWKIESGRYVEAVETLDGYIKNMKSVRSPNQEDWRFTVDLVAMRKQLVVWRNEWRKAQKAA